MCYNDYVATDNTDLIRRACAAWFHTGGADVPADNVVKDFEGKRYVVLKTSDYRTLAVYRVRPASGGRPGQLKRLVRWPPEVAPR